MSCKLGNLDLSDPKSLSSVLRLLESHILGLQNEVIDERRMRKELEERCKSLQQAFGESAKKCDCKGFKLPDNEYLPVFNSPVLISRETTKKGNEELDLPACCNITESIEPIIATSCRRNLKERNFDNASNSSNNETKYRYDMVTGKNLFKSPPKSPEKFNKNLKQLSLKHKKRSVLKIQNMDGPSEITDMCSTTWFLPKSSKSKNFCSEDIFQLSDSDSESKNAFNEPIEKDRNITMTSPYRKKQVYPSEKSVETSVVFVDSEEDDCEAIQFNVKQIFNIECRDCQRFVDFLGAAVTSEKVKQIVNKCKRHTSGAGIPHTPEGFWNPHMIPDNESDILFDYRFVKKNPRL